MDVAYFDTYEEIAGLQTYRKKPVCIQAIQIKRPFIVNTLEGTRRGNAGDYLIKGIKGELYPCKADIFESTYELDRINNDTTT